MKYLVNHMTLSIDNGTFTLYLTKKKSKVLKKKTFKNVYHMKLFQAIYFSIYVNTFICTLCLVEKDLK